jgi:hypothetical protein
LDVLVNYLFSFGKIASIALLHLLHTTLVDLVPCLDEEEQS